MSFDPKFFWEQAKAIGDDDDFNECALALFQYQSVHVPVYREYIRLLGRKDKVNHFSKIPFLPIELFKNHVVTDQKEVPDLFFSSSGTTGQVTSKHFVTDPKIYDEGLLKGFIHFYGSPSQYCFFALLPSYLERNNSSLIYMMQKLMQASGDSEAGFFLNNFDELTQRLKTAIQKKKKIFLIGVTYALLDFFETADFILKDTIIIETGGMKGRRKELIKPEVHRILSEHTGMKEIHSEYGMTELLSQAWSKGNGIFECPPWMKIIINELHDPFANLSKEVTGVINAIDLANIHSCAFLQTQDLGRTKDNHKFEVLGRLDHSELRGCNLMIG